MTEPSKYQTLEVVATGGTAVLHKAIQTSLDRVVAVKKLHQHLTEDENFTRRFILEAKAAASLDHENIVKIIDFGSDDESYFMVMEFIEGESLRDVLDRHRQLPVDVALAIVYEVCRGLEHAHAKGIVHRDIKPGNIMITRSGRVKITDFGLAKLTQAGTQHTATNSILGTPLYMSPEQAYGESVDHRSDLFSLGTVLYELLTGAQPFRDENYMGIIQNIINRNAPHPSRHDVELAGPVQSLLSKAMNKSREARFQSARSFRESIENHMGAAHLKASGDAIRRLLDADGQTVVLPRTAIERKRRRTVRRSLIAALVFAAITGAAHLTYTLAPERVHPVIDNVVSWGATRLERPTVQSSSTGDAGTNPYIHGITALPVLADSSRVEKTAPPAAVSPPAEEKAGSPDSFTGRAAVPVTPSPESPRAASSEIGTVTSPDRQDGVSTEPPDSPVAAPGPAPVAAVQSTPEARSMTEQAQPGWLRIQSEPDAEIWIDGHYRGDSSRRGSIELTPGMHRLECRHPSHKTYYDTVTIVPGEMSIRNVILEKRLGRLSLHTNEGAEVYVDGVLRGTTPLGSSIELDAGTHLVTVKKAGYNVWNNQIQVDADDTLTLRITLNPIY